MPKKVEISYKTILFTVFFLISLWFIYFIREIILQFFIALLIMSIFNPIVSKLAMKKVSRGLSILAIYLLLLLGAGFAIGAIIPPLIEQTTSFVNNVPKFLANLGVSSFISEQATGQFFAQLGSIPSYVAKTTVSVFSNVLALVAVLVFAFYLLAERDKLIDQLGVYIGEERKRMLVRIINNTELRLGGWARGEAGLMFVVGLANFIGFRLLGIPFALALAILAGLLEMVPYIGPIIASIPAILIGFGISPVIGIAVAALVFLIQQLENYVLVPKIMQRSVGVNPIITLLALAIGFKLSGVIGLLISVPVFLVLQVLTKEYLASRGKIAA
jgi:predicted PurR-regulated permease PerM